MASIDFPSAPLNSFVASLRFAHEAMAATFEAFVASCEPQYAEQAAWAAFEELDRLELELSRFVEQSDIARVNRLPVHQPLPVTLETFECLEISRRIQAETHGAFDVTIGGLAGPFPAELPRSGEERCGMDLLRLDAAEHTVEVLAPVQIDLGGVGKGYAVDRMVEMLRDWSMERVLIHGGCSSARALGGSDLEGWSLTLCLSASREELFRLCLREGAVSGSGLKPGNHIVDPITGRSVRDRRAAWSFAPTAAVADALSTAFMVMAFDDIERYCLSHPDTAAVIVPEKGEPRVALGSACEIQLERCSRGGSS